MERETLHVLLVTTSRIFYEIWFDCLINASSSYSIYIRGGVDDTWLEAKDTQKKIRSQGQKCSRPRTKDTGASVLPKKFFSGEKGLKNFFSGNLQLRKTTKGLHKFSARFLAFSNKNSMVQKIVLPSSRRQGNFRELEASRPWPRI